MRGEPLIQLAAALREAEPDSDGRKFHFSKPKKSETEYNEPFLLIHLFHGTDDEITQAKDDFIVHNEQTVAPICIIVIKPETFSIHPLDSKPSLFGGRDGDISRTDLISMAFMGLLNWGKKMMGDEEAFQKLRAERLVRLPNLLPYLSIVDEVEERQRDIGYVPPVIRDMKP